MKGNDVPRNQNKGLKNTGLHKLQARKVVA